MENDILDTDTGSFNIFVLPSSFSIIAYILFGKHSIRPNEFDRKLGSHFFDVRGWSGVEWGEELERHHILIAAEFVELGVSEGFGFAAGV